MEITPGSLLFYRSSGTFFDRVIELLAGKYVHVAIAISSTEKIEMLGQGCVKMPITENTIGGIWHYVPSTHIGLEAALNWLHGQIGQPYGWEDLLDVLDRGHSAVTFEVGHKDCSHLAADFLQKSGYPMGKFEPQHDRVTPMMLANFLGVK